MTKIKEEIARAYFHWRFKDDAVFPDDADSFPREICFSFAYQILSIRGRNES